MPPAVSKKIPFMYFFVRRSNFLMVQAFRAEFIIILRCVISYDAGSSWKRPRRRNYKQIHVRQTVLWFNCMRRLSHLRFTFTLIFWGIFLFSLTLQRTLSSHSAVRFDECWCKQEKFLQASDKRCAKSEKCWVAAAGWLTPCWKGGWRHSGHMWKTARTHTHTHLKFSVFLRALAGRHSAGGVSRAKKEELVALTLFSRRQTWNNLEWYFPFSPLLSHTVCHFWTAEKQKCF